MHSHITRFECDVCGETVELQGIVDPDALGRHTNWISVYGDPDPLARDDWSYICPECIERIGRAHAFGLAEPALQRFDPTTYEGAKLMWRTEGGYLTRRELLIHIYGGPREDHDGPNGD